MTRCHLRGRRYADMLGLSNFAASIGIGVSGAGPGTRLRAGLVFGLFEAGMPIAGLLLGHGLARTLGGWAQWVGAALLIATGCYGLLQALRGTAVPGGGDTPAQAAGQRAGRLLVTGFALSIDNLAVGFALGAYHVNLAVAAAVIGAVSVILSCWAWNSATASAPGPASAGTARRPGPDRRRHCRRCQRDIASLSRYQDCDRARHSRATRNDICDHRPLTLAEYSSNEYTILPVTRAYSVHTTSDIRAGDFGN